MLSVGVLQACTDFTPIANKFDSGAGCGSPI